VVDSHSETYNNVKYCTFSVIKLTLPLAEPKTNLIIMLAWYEKSYAHEMFPIRSLMLSRIGNAAVPQSGGVRLAVKVDTATPKSPATKALKYAHGTGLCPRRQMISAHSIHSPSLSLSPPLSFALDVRAVVSGCLFSERASAGSTGYVLFP
jgi:hypothetical protein